MKNTLLFLRGFARGLRLFAVLVSAACIIVMAFLAIGKLIATFGFQGFFIGMLVFWVLVAGVSEGCDAVRRGE